jgi:hypothetical protein
LVAPSLVGQYRYTLVGAPPVEVRVPTISAA